MSNGKRTLADIQATMKGTDILAMASKLQTDGYISLPEDARRQRSTAAAKRDGDALTPIHSGPTLSIPADASAKQQMLAALEQLAPPGTTASLASRIAATDQGEKLQEMMDEWFSLLVHDPANQVAARQVRESVNKSIMESYMTFF